MAKKPPAVQSVEDDEDEVELTELDEDADEAPAKGKGKSAPAADTFGVRQLIALAKEKYGKEYTPREVRTLLRKLARDGAGVNREIVAGNKSKYEWTGPDDPEVKVVLKAIKGGKIEESKKAALDKLKSDKAAKVAAKAKADAKAGNKAKAAAPPADEDDDDDD